MSDSPDGEEQPAEYGSVLCVRAAPDESDDGPVIHKVAELAGRTMECRRARANGTLVSSSSSDELMLTFLDEPSAAPVRCGLQLAGLLAGLPGLDVRLGVHAGAVLRRRDEQTGGSSIAGPAAAIARILAGSGGANQMLISADVVETLRRDPEWAHRFVAAGGYELPTGKHAPMFTVSAPAAGAATRDRSSVEDAAERSAIVTRWIAVSLSTSSAGDTLVYAPQRSGEDDAVSAPVFVAIDRAGLQGELDGLRRCVSEINRLAINGKPRGELAIEPLVNSIVAHALPPEGLLKLVGPDVHPQFQLIQDFAAQLPWEAIEEIYYRCRECGEISERFFAPLPQPLFCRRCGKPTVIEGGKLALRTYLSHVVPGQDADAPRGDTVFMFEDPNQDLCSAAADPDAVCRDHLAEVEALLAEMGYTVGRFRGPNVTADRVLDALQDPSVLGIYYLGHGASDGREGCLQLADGPLPASRLRTARAVTPFIFLNACEAANGRRWDLDGHPGSVAAALASPSHRRTVIAPVAPVVNVQAAQFASEVFRAAHGFAPLGEAVRHARRTSLDRYQAGKPDLAWCLYRFFGRPHRSLPAPRDAAVGVGNSVHVTRTFDGEFQLRTDVFSFGVEDVLERAAHRRNTQGRRRISVLDFIAGLVRRGDLTRYLLSGLVSDPDVIFERLQAQPMLAAEAAADRTPAREPFSVAMAKLTVRDRRDFDRDLLAHLNAADREAQRRPGADQRITERDVLLPLLAGPTWDGFASADYRASELRYRLDIVLGKNEVDENGRISLSGLAPESCAVVERAHSLAQHMGVCPITHRLLLVAFLTEPRGHAASGCRQLGADPEEVLAWLLSAQEAAGNLEAALPQRFGLSPELCERIVTPTLEIARRRVPAWQLVTEEALFMAFCEVADPAFKRCVRSISPVDLDALASQRRVAARNQGAEHESGEGPRWLDRLSPGARRVIRQAHQLAQATGAAPIPTRLVLAAFLADAERYVSRVLRELMPDLKFDLVRDRLVERSTLPGRPAQRFPLDDQAAGEAIRPMIDEALELCDEAEPIDEALLFRAFASVAPREFKQALRRFGWNLDLDRLARLQPQAPGPASLRREDFDDDVWRCVRQAVAAAREQGIGIVRSPHLFVGMLAEHVPIPRRAGLQPTQLGQLRQALLSVVPAGAPAAADATDLSPNAMAILRRSVDRAKSEGRARATVEDLVVGFFHDGGGVVGHVLDRVLGPSDRNLLS